MLDFKLKQLLDTSAGAEIGEAGVELLLYLKEQISPEINKQMEEGNAPQFSIVILKTVEKNAKLIENHEGLSAKQKQITLEILLEMVSLLYPRSDYSYSLIPIAIRQIEFGKMFADKRVAHLAKTISNNPEIGDVFIKEIKKIERNPLIIACLVSLCAGELLGEMPNYDQGFPVQADTDTLTGLVARPRIKAGQWLSYLGSTIRAHFLQLRPTISGEVDKQYVQYKKEQFKYYLASNYEIRALSVVLSTVFTERLLQEGLLQHSITIQSSVFGSTVRKQGYYVWAGKEALKLPKIFALPMVTPPAKWTIDPTGLAHNGGYYLTEFRDIPYYGFIFNKQKEQHGHRLLSKRVEHISRLQNITLGINAEMITFIDKYNQDLTNLNLLYISHKWLDSDAAFDKSGDLYNEAGAQLPVYMQKVPEARYEINVKHQLYKNRIETLRHRESLEVGKFYLNREIYWPSVLDFRGRLYRIGALNPQLSEFPRSLLGFKAKGARVQRRKQNVSTYERFKKLLAAILSQDALKIAEWDAVFGDRQLNRIGFEQLLLNKLGSGELDFLQVGQLLQLRAGNFSEIGVYFDASASAYQVMSVLVYDVTLAELTNVIGDHERNDIYGSLLKYLKDNALQGDVLVRSLGSKLNRQRISRQAMGLACSELAEHLRQNFTRKLVKAAAMPLIYGKTAMNFQHDLLGEIGEGNIMLKRHALSVSSFILNSILDSPYMQDCKVLMNGLRGFSSILCGYGEPIVLTNPYFDSQIMYYKESVAQIKVFRKSKGKGFTSKKVSLSQILLDNDGAPQRSCSKQRRSFVANYVHFLDAYVCHYVIDQCTKANIRLSTVHDSFFVEPDNLEYVNACYRQGLLNTRLIHLKNIMNWLSIVVSQHYHETENFATLAQKNELQSLIRRLSLWTSTSENELISDECCVDFIKSIDKIVSTLRITQKRIAFRDNIEKIILLIKMFNQERMSEFLFKYKQFNRFSIFS